MARLFTLDRAKALLPQVASHLREAIGLKDEYQEADLGFKTGLERISMMGGMLVDTREAQSMRSRRDTSIARLKDALNAIQDLGCVIKDLDAGLIDFPTLYRGQEVYLCWKLGEDGIAWWHGVDEGFRGRKPIDSDFIANHTGDDAA